MYSLEKSNLTVHQCHEKVLCSLLHKSTACHVQGSVVRSELSGLLSSMLASHCPTLPKRGLDFCSQICTAVADRQEQHKSGLLCLQVSGHTGIRDTK